MNPLDFFVFVIIYDVRCDLIFTQILEPNKENPIKQMRQKILMACPRDLETTVDWQPRSFWRVVASSLQLCHGVDRHFHTAKEGLLYHGDLCDLLDY